MLEQDTLWGGRIMAAMLAPTGLMTRLTWVIKGRIGFIFLGVLTFILGGFTTGSTEPPSVPVATDTPSLNIAELKIIVPESNDVPGLGVTANRIEMALDESLYLQKVGVTYDCADSTPVEEHWRISCEAESGPHTVVELFGQLDDEDQEPPLKGDAPLTKVTLLMGVSDTPSESGKAFAAVTILLREIFPEWNTGLITLSQWIHSGVAEQEIAMDGKLLKYSNQISTLGSIFLSFEPQ